MFSNRKSVSLRNTYFYGTSAIVGALGAYAIDELDYAGGWR